MYLQYTRITGRRQTSRTNDCVDLIKWDILGLTNGHALYTIGHENESIHGVGILVHKHLVSSIRHTHKANERIAQLF